MTFVFHHWSILFNYLRTPMNKEIYLAAYERMCWAKWMALTYDENRSICKYVHSTSRGHEAIQLAAGMQLLPTDYAAPYYRDESMLLGIGYQPHELMMQLLGKKNDPFSGGRSYYSHPNNRDPKYPLMPHQSSATGMQAIPATGMAQGVKYLKKKNLLEKIQQQRFDVNTLAHLQTKGGTHPVVLCSLGDGSVTEGEVSEAWQFAVLHQLPILYLIQDNDWGISVSGEEARAMDAYDYAAGFKGMKRARVDGSEFYHAWNAMKDAIEYVRSQHKPMLLHAKVPLLGHHTSGVRKEWYRTEGDLLEHSRRDPLPKLHQFIIKSGHAIESELQAIDSKAKSFIAEEFQRAVASPDPEPETAMHYIEAPTHITEEKGNRNPEGKEKTVMVDAALHAVEEILAEYPEAIFFGQDVGRRLGGVFREAATLAEKFGDDRVFNTAIQEAYIVGSTAGLSAVGVKAMVEIQFADYIWTAVNQLVTELSKSCYLTCGKFPVSAVIRIPIGAYGGGGPYHSGCVETSILAVKGIKVAYPSNAADMKGLLKAAFHDPNPVVFFEHKGLYWSKNPGTEEAKCVEPDRDYILPFGKANVVLQADEEQIDNGNSVCVVTYGMGVYWAKQAAKELNGAVEILDLRTLYPLDEERVFASVKKHGKCLVLTEETLRNSFAESLANRITHACFQSLDAPVETLGAKNVSAIPLNMDLEKFILPNAEMVRERLEGMLAS